MPGTAVVKTALLHIYSAGYGEHFWEILVSSAPLLSRLNILCSFNAFWLRDCDDTHAMQRVSILAPIK